MPILINKPAARFALPVRHWRIVPHGSFRGDAVFITEIEMAASPGGANLCTGGSAFGTNLTGSIAACFDNNLTTFCNAQADTGGIATWGYVLPTAALVQEVRLTSPASFNLMPVGFTLQSSADSGATWTSQAIVTGITPWTSGGQTQSFPVSPSPIAMGLGRSNAIGWRINATADNGLGQLSLAEMICATSVGGAAVTGGGFMSSANHNAFNRPASLAFDGNNSTYWSTNNNPTGAIGRIFAARTNLAEMRLLMTSTDLSGAPRDFTIQYTEDGVTWNTVSTQTNITGWVANTARSFTF